MVTKSNKCTPQNGSFSEGFGDFTSQQKQSSFKHHLVTSFSLLPCFFHLDRPRFFGLPVFSFHKQVLSVHSKHPVTDRPIDQSRSEGRLQRTQRTLSGFPCMIHQGDVPAPKMIRLSTLKHHRFVHQMHFFFCVACFFFVWVRLL